jgi:hypothetical protein
MLNGARRPKPPNHLGDALRVLTRYVKWRKKLIKEDPDHWDPVRIKLNQQKAEFGRFIQRAYEKAAAMAAAEVPAENFTAQNENR